MKEARVIATYVISDIHGEYDKFMELLETIKEIRLSERRLYQKITDIFETTSVDYDKDSEEAYTFFKIVQNKFIVELIQKLNIWV